MEETATTPRLGLGRRVPAHVFAMVGDERSDEDVPLLTLPPSIAHLGPGLVALAETARANEALTGSVDAVPDPEPRRSLTDADVVTLVVERFVDEGPLRSAALAFAAAYREAVQQ